MPDDFTSQQTGLASPAPNAYNLAVDADADLAHTTRGIHANADVTITVLMAGNASNAAADRVNFTLAAGASYPYRIRRLVASNPATAGTVVGLY